MFNVSALLLHGRRTLKCVVTEVVLFSVVASNTDISQGSVTSQLRCGGIFSDSTIANFLLILIVKKLKIGQYLMKL